MIVAGEETGAEPDLIDDEKPEAHAEHSRGEGKPVMAVLSLGDEVRRGTAPASTR